MHVGKVFLAAVSVLIQLPLRYINRSTCLTDRVPNRERHRRLLMYYSILKSDGKSTSGQGVT